LNAPPAPEHFRSGQSLHGLTQAHVIGQNDTAAAGGEDGAPFLIGQQFCL
jgi:hypothetical protein